ncbi:MAG TPA: hypothetical protein VJM12_22180 [Pyrinomonadaceae bacterium]|nr:hypothetical protein [Pyrinomonadaceae bacterium]
MKKITALCCLFAILVTSLFTMAPPMAGAAVSDHGGKIESKYDGFNHETVVMLKKMKVSCGGPTKQTCVSLVASLHCPGVQLDYVRYVKLQIIFETKDWDRRHPLNERELFVVADGERLKLGKMSLVKQNTDTNKLIDVMSEVLEVSISYPTFMKMASAETVEMKVGKSNFALKEKNLAALRDLNNRVKYK